LTVTGPVSRFLSRIRVKVVNLQRSLAKIVLVILATQGLFGAPLHLHVRSDHGPSSVAHAGYDNFDRHLDRVQLTPAQAIASLGDDLDTWLPALSAAAVMLAPRRAIIGPVASRPTTLATAPNPGTPKPRGPPYTPTY
jgi:hypothetical protein